MENIETERLMLTPWRDCEEDAQGLYSYAKDPEVGPNAGWKPHESPKESRCIIRELFIKSSTWAIREKETLKTAERWAIPFPVNVGEKDI